MKVTGEYAWLLAFEGEEEAANEAARSAAAAIRTSGMPGLVDVVPAARTVLVLGSPELDSSRLEAFEGAPRPAGRALPQRRHEIRMTPDGADLDEIASRCGLSPDAFLEVFVQLEFTVGFLGFSPGFAYLYGLPKAFHLPRRGTPRTAVPAGSIALAGPYVGIYPAPTPGGWNLLGRTQRRLFDLRADPPFLFASGRPGAVPAMTEARGLLVLEPGLLTTVQDLGRYGWASFGVPAAGALDEEALRFANRLVGNAENAAALEITLVGPVLRAAGDLDLAVAGGEFGPAPGRAVRVADGEVISLVSRPGATRAIAAVGGGIDVPLVLGSRSTCVSGRFGGFQGRRLLARGSSRGLSGFDRAARGYEPPTSRSRARATSSCARSRDRTKASSTRPRARRSGARAGKSSRSRTAWASGFRALPSASWKPLHAPPKGRLAERSR